MVPKLAGVENSPAEQLKKLDALRAQLTLKKKLLSKYKAEDWYPIRRAAKLTAYAIQKSKIAAERAIESELAKKPSNFQKRFTDELKEGFKDLEKKRFEEKPKPKCKACCACPETKQVRDACIVEKGEENCSELIEAHKK
ncbi:hypothetical protein HAZT_HAZT009299 [Hyalella azteca]|uniref:Mediator of RNA polymerase II transcription subunit 9 n=1 Tax=Hyalella azteca TaxID=294128 RepID=A0A6A0HFP2_HYAAZ|nr:hypothetical protein HAZT_HAZT009299 [Hyalella azteca]